QTEPLPPGGEPVAIALIRAPCAGRGVGTRHHGPAWADPRRRLHKSQGPGTDRSQILVLTAAAPTLAPHRVWNNYYTNSLGFADEEFSIDKPAGTLRIMGSGDSFTFGTVSYPENVLKIVQDSFNRHCSERKI